MSDLNPAVLRERAERLDDLAEDLRVDCHSMHGNGVELGDWEARRSCCHWANESVDCTESATDLRLLADLLDAIGDPANLRILGSAFDLPYLTRITDVLEAHRD